MKQSAQYVVRETTTTGMWDYETVTKPKDSSSPEQTGASGKPRHTVANTTLAFAVAGRDGRIEIPTEPTKKPKSGMATSTPDDAELLKELTDLGMIQMRVSSLCLKTIRSFLRHMDDVVDTSPDKCHRHRAIGEMANPRNQHFEISKIQNTDKVADDSTTVLH